MKPLSNPLNRCNGAVRMIIIDSLGSLHYVDKCEFENSVGQSHTPAQSHELVLTNVIGHILSLRKVVVVVSKCSLFDETRLHVEWPFRNSKAPLVPADFMPSTWASLVTHTVVMYHLESDGSQDDRCSRRGMVVLATKEGHRGAGRKQVVCAAAVAVIGGDDVGEEHLHKGE